MNKVNIIKEIDNINKFLQSELWFDFEVKEYTKNRLCIIGSIDPTYPPNIKIHFKDIFFLSLPIEWKTDTSKKILSLVEGEDAININKQFQVEQGYYLFQFKAEYYPDDFKCLIGAKEISYTLVGPSRKPSVF